jgi:anti-sigma regulatory factor (Ser/Thr protein kinase)
MAAAKHGALLTLELPHRAEAAPAARRALTALNGSLHLVSEPRLRDAQLLLSELVTNAVRHGDHAGRSVEVTVTADEGVMRVEVRNLGAGFDPSSLPTPSPDRAGGWGLHLVAALAHRWGVGEVPETLVWFEIDRPQRAAPVDPRPTPPQ